jgi:hypothetical protein
MPNQDKTRIAGGGTPALDVLHFAATIEPVKRVREPGENTRRPVVLTVNGKAELVVQDAESYQQIVERLERLEAVEAIQRGHRGGQ